MAYNGLKTGTTRELSEYQKRIEAIDNVILCVAEVERMISDIGNNLLPEPEVLEQARARCSRRARMRSGRQKSLYNGC
jgi:hypothetical protein